MSSRRIPPQSGVSFSLEAGDVLRVVDPLGEQVADLFAFDVDDLGSWLSSGRTFDYANNIYVGEGTVLYSNRSEPMLTVVRDDVGRHDFLLTPCSQETFDILYDCEGHHPSCFENLVDAFAEHDVPPERIGTTLNLFMNVRVARDGELKLDPPLSEPGDCVELRAERDLLVGLTSCSAEKTNNGTFGPIDWEILRG